MRGAFRAVNVATAVVALASALGVLGSDLLEARYAEAHGDAPWFVALYAVLQAFIAITFARDGALVPWLAIARALGGCAFVALLDRVGPMWMAVSPSRYVYQVFDWSQQAPLVLIAFVFLGRGAWNTFNAFYFTSGWWHPLRLRRPLLGRVVTAVPIAIIVFCVWRFLELARFHSQSADAQEVARIVLDGLDCEAVRDHDGQTTTDLRQRGDRHYTVRIAWACALTRVLVADQAGHVGTAAGPRPECCDGS